MPRSRSRSPAPRHRSDREKRRRDDPTTKSSKRRSRSPDDRESRKKRRNDDDRQRTSRDRSVSPGKDKKRKKDKEARKAEKQRQREDEEARQIAELSVYSAADNPFHDVNLGQQFKWHKKAEKEKKAGLSAAEAARKDELRRIEAREELERLNKRRAEREVEQQLREEEEARMARMAESAQMAEWIAKDGDFQLEQERRRAGIRLKERRAKAIDFLALNLKFAGPNAGAMEEDDGLGLDEIGLEIDFDEPYAIFENLSLEQTEELHDDIQKYLTLEQSELNIDFWTNMMVVCKDQLEKLNAAHRAGPEAAATALNVISAVEPEITALLSGKSYDQLIQLQRQIQSKLGSGEPVDVDYWEGLLKSLLVWKSKAKLKSLHEVVVQNRLEQLRKRQRDEALQAQQELLAGVSVPQKRRRGWANAGEEVAISSGTAPEKEAEILPPDEEVEEYDRSMSPVPIDLSSLPYEERQLEIIDELTDRSNLFDLRRTVTSSRFVPRAAGPPAETQDVAAPSGADLESEALYKAEADKNMDDEEELFNLEELIVNPTTYTWEDKYRPRKPRYFNRVHTGYEWNKYNQTHYDTDNPPPKVVQGYKFNIFYPDLIDKSVAPTYKIVREPGNEDTVLLHFTAGPPYEDIAFRVVNREWEYSHKRGFRSSFDRGCLSLWFNFRRNFYRK